MTKSSQERVETRPEVQPVKALEEQLLKLIAAHDWQGYQTVMIEIRDMWQRLKPTFAENYFGDMQRVTESPN